MTSEKEELKDFCNQALCSSSHPPEKQLFSKYQILLYLGLQYRGENRQEHTNTLQDKSKSCPLLPAMPAVLLRPRLDRPEGRRGSGIPPG